MNTVDAQLPQKSLRALLVDDHVGLRSAMRLLLEQAAGLDVVGELADAHNLPASMCDLTPDLLLLDWELQELRTARMRRQLLHAVRTVTPHIYIIGLCGCQSSGQLCIFTGVDAFVSKTEPPELLLAAVRLATLRICRQGDSVTDYKSAGGVATQRSTGQDPLTGLLPH